MKTFDEDDRAIRCPVGSDDCPGLLVRPGLTPHETVILAVQHIETRHPELVKNGTVKQRQLDRLSGRRISWLCMLIGHRSAEKRPWSCRRCGKTPGVCVQHHVQHSPRDLRCTEETRWI